MLKTNKIIRLLLLIVVVSSCLLRFKIESDELSFYVSDHKMSNLKKYCFLANFVEQDCFNELEGLLPFDESWSYDEDLNRRKYAKMKLLKAFHFLMFVPFVYDSERPLLAQIEGILPEQFRSFVMNSDQAIVSDGKYYNEKMMLFLLQRIRHISYQKEHKKHKRAMAMYESKNGTMTYFAYGASAILGTIIATIVHEVLHYSSSHKKCPKTGKRSCDKTVYSPYGASFFFPLLYVESLEYFDIPYITSSEDRDRFNHALSSCEVVERILKRPKQMPQSMKECMDMALEWSDSFD